MEQTNEERNYLVYMHINKSNSKVYIGITAKLPHQRWGLNGHNYKTGQTAFFRALKKYPDWDNDWDHIILQQELTKDEACDAEIELIAKYKSNCCRYQNPSYGYNMTDGGEGRNGSYGLKGEKNPNYGKTGKLNSRSRAVYCVEDDLYFESICIASKMYNISTSQISHRCKNQLTHADIDKHFLYEEDVCHELIARCLLQKRNHRVYCVETKQWFEDAMEASLYAHVGVSAVRSSCKKLGQLAAGKNPDTNDSLHWLYEKDVNEINIRNALNYKDYADKHMSHSVYCIETDTFYANAVEAEKLFGICSSGICNACNGTYGYAGTHPETGQPLHWLYAENVTKENIIKTLNHNKTIRPQTAVYCIELNMAFSSMSIPAKALGIAVASIKKCIDGLTDHAGRKADDGSFLHWIYLRDYQHKDEIIVLDECNIEKFSKKIYCVELDRFFTTREAARVLHIDRSYLQECLRGDRETVGKHPQTKEPLHWRYVYNKSYKGE